MAKNAPHRGALDGLPGDPGRESPMTLERLEGEGGLVLDAGSAIRPASAGGAA